MLWINFLHLYQPANADAFVIREATERSYYRIVRALEEHPQVKFTFNINGCLLKRWEELGYRDLIRRIHDLAKKGQVELVGTAAYHPLLPLVPSGEIRRQIRENGEIMCSHFGEDYKPRGFFLPEMAYSARVGKIVADLGYEWLILDELAITGKLGEADHSCVYLDKNSGLKALVRSRRFSLGFVPNICARILDGGEQASGPDVVVTATDAELYGLRHIDHTAEFEKFLKRPEVKTSNISAYIDNYRNDIIKIRPPKHSWETLEKELEQNKPFLVWQDKDNALQQELWRFFGFVHKVLKKNQKDPQYEWARWHFVRGLASCTWWWASGRDFSHIFGPVAWNPDQIGLGANEFVRAVRALDSESTRADKLKAEKKWLKIKDMIWSKHWREYWKK